MCQINNCIIVTLDMTKFSIRKKEINTCTSTYYLFVFLHGENVNTCYIGRFDIEQKKAQTENGSKSVLTAG